MQISVHARGLLLAIFTLSRASVALSRPLLQRRLHCARSELQAALEELTRLEFVDPRRLRLTLAGLAVAVTLGARARSDKGRAAAKSEPLILPRAPIALFSAREAPRAVA